MAAVPTARMRIIDIDNANQEILDFAASLVDRGEEPRFEVRYPSPEHLTPDEQDAWQVAQEDTFDAVEVVDGEIRTLPPYAELEAS